MFAKSTITLFVLAISVSSLSGLSIGSTTAEPETDELILTQDVSDNASRNRFETFMLEKPKNIFGGLVLLEHAAIQGSNTKGENHMGAAAIQENLIQEGGVPEGGNIFGAFGVGTYNAIQQVDSNAKNYVGTHVVQSNNNYVFDS